MTTSTQFVIEIKPSGFTQTLVPHGGSNNWSFPVYYDVTQGNPAAELAEIGIDGVNTQLTQGTQTIAGEGIEVDLIVELGSCPAVTIEANPYKDTACTYPFISKFFAGGDGSFQIICSAEKTSLQLDVSLTFHGDVETPPPSAAVSLQVDGQQFAKVPPGLSTFTPSGSTFVFNVASFQGSGKMKLAYTYTIT